MKSLEDSVLPFVGRMGEGTKTNLDILQQWTLACWAVEKAMVWEYVSRDGTVFYSDQDRAGLRDGTIPPNTIVWLGGHIGTETFTTLVGNAHTAPGSSIHLEAHITTFAYERLVIQILSVRPYEHSNPYALLNCNHRVFGPAIVRIWPTLDHASWPPGVILDNGMLDTFHNRCAAENQDESGFSIQ